MKLRIRAGFLAAVTAFALADRWGLFLPFLLAAALHEAGHLAALAALAVKLLLAALFRKIWPLFALSNLSLGFWNLLPLPGRDGCRLLQLARGVRRIPPAL